MLQDFNKNETVQKIKKAKKIEQELKEAEELLSKVSADRMGIAGTKEELENAKNTALITKQKVSIFSKIASIFHRGEYYKANEQIKLKDKELANIEKEYEELVKKEKEIDNKLIVLKEKSESLKAEEFIKEEDGKLIITDENSKSRNTEEKSLEQIESNKRAIVHCTNFFPKDNKILSNYDGNKIFLGKIDYKGVTKEVRYLHPRHEVHMTISNRVESTGDGSGNWDKPKYMIVERYDVHENELEEVDAGDTWTKGTSMQLSDDAVILVDIGEKDKLLISENELGKYNIVYYQGNPTKCLQNFLTMNGYEISQKDNNVANHAYSNRCKAEEKTTARNAAINYIKDSTVLSKELPTFTIDEIAQIADIGILSRYATTVEISDKQLEECMKNKKLTTDQMDEYKKIVDFIICLGVEKTEDGRYAFKSDEKVLKTINDLKENQEKLPDYIDIDFVNSIYDKQQEIVQENENKKLPSMEEISSMTFEDLYKFENYSAAKRVSENSEKRMIFGKENSKIRDAVANNYSKIKEQIMEDDGIECKGIDERQGFFIKKIQGYITVDKFEQINNEFVKAVDNAKLKATEKSERNVEFSEQELER